MDAPCQHITEDEFKRLQPHCQCDIHRMRWYDLAKYRTSPRSVGCLAAGCAHASLSVIAKTREFVDARDRNLVTNWWLHW